MTKTSGWRVWLLGTFWLAGLAGSWAEEEFTVASYNLEGYRDVATGSRPSKSMESRTKVQESLLTLRADIVALQEVGSRRALDELRMALERRGLRYPHWEYVTGFDTNIQVAVLSRFPFIARQPHTNQGFLLYGRRFRVARGFAEVEVQVNDRYRLTLISAHLKSRRESVSADQAELREQEAICLRRIIDTRLQAQPKANLVVLGDFNDHPDSMPLKIILARGKRDGLVDTRPSERNGDGQAGLNAEAPLRRISWTHFYAHEDVYSRIDYILVSRGMAREWNPEGTFVLALPDWGVASDHRPIVARFQAVDR